MTDFRVVGYTVGVMTLGLAALMLAPAVVDMVEGSEDWRAFIAAAILTGLVGGALTLGSHGAQFDKFTIQDAFLLVVASWVMLPLFGALPFMFGAYQATVIDSIFESVSGMTTTGSTVLIGIEYLPRGILVWRALLHWVGGLGIVVFALVFLPTLRIGGMELFRSQGRDGEGALLVRFRDIAPTLLLVYTAFTVACAVLYRSFGMPLMDAICNAMATISTGGFATSDSSFAQYGAAIQITCIVFMLIAGMPFLRFVELVNLRVLTVHRDSQVQTYLGIVLAASVLVVALIWFTPPPSGDGGAPARPSGVDAILPAVFSVVSMLTGTGFATINYGAWGDAFILIFIMLMLIGGCAGSASCSIKIFRYQILGLLAIGELKKMRHPSRVVMLQFGGRPLPHEVVASVVSFFFMYFVTMAVLFVAMVLTGEDMITSISAVIANLSNVGPGFGPKVGPVGTYSSVNDSGKVILILAMLLGRLELMSVFILMTPGFWRR